MLTRSIVVDTDVDADTDANADVNADTDDDFVVIGVKVVLLAFAGASSKKIFFLNIFIFVVLPSLASFIFGGVE